MLGLTIPPKANCVAGGTTDPKQGDNNVPIVKTDKDRLSDAMKLLEEMTQERAALRRTIKSLEREEDTRESIRKQILGIAAHDPVDILPWTQKLSRGQGERGIPTCLWTDWHIGEEVTAERTNGLNVFNLKVARRRAQTLVESTVELAFEHMGRARYDYPGACIMIGGDMITGNIHPDLMITNELTNQEQIIECTDLLYSAIKQMAKKFKRLLIVCVTGNHPRDTSYSRKMPSKLRTYTSNEWVIFCNLKKRFEDNPNIQFYIPGGTDAIFSLVGHRYLLTHGDANGVKGGDGIIGALGPIMRGAIKVHDSEAQIGIDIDTIVMGHYHTEVDVMNSVIVGPSFIGYNEHGRTGIRTKYTRPAQLLWFTHPKYGITARWTVYLEDKPKSKIYTPKDWASWPQS